MGVLNGVQSFAFDPLGALQYFQSRVGLFCAASVFYRGFVPACSNWVTCVGTMRVLWPRRALLVLRWFAGPVCNALSYAGLLAVT